MNITHTHRIELPRAVEEYIRSIACQLDCLPNVLQQMEDRIMSKISEFDERQQARNAAIAAAVDGIAADLKALDDKITEFQNSEGTLSAEDQARLDALETASGALVDRLAAVDATH